MKLNIQTVYLLMTSIYKAIAKVYGKQIRNKLKYYQITYSILRYLTSLFNADSYKWN